MEKARNKETPEMVMRKMTDEAFKTITSNDSKPGGDEGGGKATEKELDSLIKAFGNL